MSDLRELYQEVIIDHSHSPRNFHKLDHSNHEAEGFNPLCGDKLTLYLKVNDKLIEEASFQGAGCAISTASASLMTEILKGKTIAAAEELFHDFHGYLTGVCDENTIDKLGKLAILAGVKDFPTRVKCATLAWHTLHAALNNSHNTVTTEI